MAGNRPPKRFSFCPTDLLGEYMGSRGKSLFGAVLRNPKDFTAYLVLADYYEDSGDPVGAECWRWLGTHRKRPASDYIKEGDHKYHWYWLPGPPGENGSWSWKVGLTSVLPGSLIDTDPQLKTFMEELDLGPEGPPLTPHLTLSDAYNFVLEVWRRAVANGWKPTD
jgi:uncharacterized protein (TIGR02996 family)